MINLFHIPTFKKIDTSKFSNLLHDKIVRDFEERFADYVGAKYAVSVNSATNAIFLLFKLYAEKYPNEVSRPVRIPSIIPLVVPNAIINAGFSIFFEDNTEWVGNAYDLWQFGDKTIIDSAQAVYKDQLKKTLYPNQTSIIYSFYPTKPIGSQDGGMIVSNDKDEIETLRELTFNGMSQEVNNWERTVKRIGYKMYMNSISAWIANENLKKLGWTKEKLLYCREFYNKHLGDKNRNTSEHLYRVAVEDNKAFIKKAAKSGVVCGIHYQAAHQIELYGERQENFPSSNEEAKTMVSIPFHEKLSQKDMKTVIELVRRNQ